MADTAPAIAAGWWADAIKAPRFNGGDPMIGMLAEMAFPTPPAPDEAHRQGFVEILRQRIEELLTKYEQWDVDPTVYLDVDYGPDKILADAARDAGLGSRPFPWKTRMSVSRDHVTVAAGYGARTVLVWASEEWLKDRPACGSQKWDNDKHMASARDYHGEPWACSLPLYHDGECRYLTPLPLCAQCGRPDRWGCHDPEEAGLRKDFHPFTAEVTHG